MISDTLSDAAAEIREYLREYPDAYAPVRAQVLQVLRHMDALRMELDRPPSVQERIKS